MIKRKAAAVWEGGLTDGRGKVKVGEHELERPISIGSRFDAGSGTNPEELVGAAHAGCFSMALAKQLSDSGHKPKTIRTAAEVHLEEFQHGYSISRVKLETQAQVSGISEDEFKRLAEDAKIGCPVSKALRGALIDLKAELVA